MEFSVYSIDVYISLIREVEENSRLTTPISAIEIPWWRSALGIQPSPFDIARSILKFHKKDYPYSKLVQIKNPKFPEALLRLEEKQTLKGYKFGVLVSMKGQRKEQEMFSNVDQSEGFTEFLKFLGKKVKLLNWSNFKGGLDTKSETTGKYSIYRKWNENEIMFHVSTMLPYSAKDDQQLERKRHIGNDSVVILFLDDDETIYVPTSISSRQIHVIIVIKKKKLLSMVKLVIKWAFVQRKKFQILVPPFQKKLYLEKTKNLENSFFQN